jgi:hypothetical protein
MGDEGVGGLLAMLDPIIKRVLEVIIPFIGGVIEFVVNAISTAINFITSIVKSVMDVIRGIADGIKTIFKGDILGGLAQIAGAAVNTIVGIVQAIFNAMISAVNVFIDFINGVIATITNTPLAKELGFTLEPINKFQLLDLTGAVRKGFAGGNNSTASSGEGNRFNNLSPRMAEGGVVYPSNGGTMVTVAEVGRPERIEPLDPNGLSERDKAMIQELSGGSGVEVNVYAAPGMDINELTRAISRQMAMEIKRGAI